MMTVEVKNADKPTTSDASQVSFRILEALCETEEFSVLRETLRLYREEIVSRQ